MSAEDRPCNGCTERYVGCHGHCELEDLWLEIQKEKQAMIQRAMSREMLVDEFRGDMVYKTKRRQKKI